MKKEKIEKMKISDNIVWGSDLEEKINELIHYELYEREVN